MYEILKYWPRFRSQNFSGAPFELFILQYSLLYEHLSKLTKGEKNLLGDQNDTIC